MHQRVLLVIPSVVSYQAFLTELTEALLAENFEVGLCCANAEQVREPLVRAFPMRIPRGLDPWGYIDARRSLRALITFWRPTLVHAHFSAGILAAATAGLGQAYGIATFQGLAYPYAERGGWLIKRAELWASQRFSLVQLVNDEDLQAVRASGLPINCELQAGFGFGCKDRFLDTPVPDSYNRSVLKRRLGIPVESKVVLFVGRFIAQKGFAELAEAIEILRDPDLCFILLGDFDVLHQCGVDSSRLMALRANPRVLMPGFKQDVLPWLDIADCFVLPSKKEGVPVSAMEAIARGVPCVMSAARGCRELSAFVPSQCYMTTKDAKAIAFAVTEALASEKGDVRPANNSHLAAFRRSLWVRNTVTRYRTSLGWA